LWLHNPKEDLSNPAIGQINQRLIIEGKRELPMFPG
jgi:hypothetical protein